ncbi:hypothetical protein CC2G_012266 [Coprinopsis cinerea AmutBmut pab1-1]|nr:hypothetical protein CC2G_012266 [Coprinopsis cinerea AmutBmut pab1-1]
MSSFIDLKDLYSQPPPPFGKPLLKYFALDPEYANLNNGSYGAPPKPVLQAALEWSHKVEANPDLFHRITYMPVLAENRKLVAEMIGAHPDEVVLVNNATTGINTVLRNFDWEAGDLLIDFTTSYHSTNTTVTYISEIPPHPKRLSFKLNYPITHAEIIAQFREFLQSPETQVGKNNKRLVVIDSIVANPGLLLPWQELVKIAKEEGLWTVIDAAHSIGQEPNINLGESQADFWVSNCHKWLLAKRSCAALYIPFRNQHIIKTTLPTSNFYVPLAKRNGDPQHDILTQFEWTGTQDLVPFLVVKDALEFRKWIGGEDKIHEYCHDLAIKGGKYLAELWGTQLLDPDGTSTVHMVNVELPIPPETKVTRPMAKYIESRLLEKEKAYSAWYFHNGKWWTRCSAQVWNDLSDFEHLGRAWLNVAKGLKEEFGQKD